MIGFNFSFLDNLPKYKKSVLVSFVKTFVKKQDSDNEGLVFKRFIEELNYQIGIKNSLYLWTEDFLDDKNFCRDIKRLIKTYSIRKKIKEKQKSYLKKQKLYKKENYLKSLSLRQAHEKPTLKQIKYYSFLCKNHNIRQEEIEGKSKLDLIILINEVLSKDKNEQL